MPLRNNGSSITCCFRRECSFPRTRYQGSKRKLARAIVEPLRDLPFTTALDAFGGTGAISYALKRLGKKTTYNDHLSFNHQIGRALIENDSVTLAEREITDIGARRTDVDYGNFIECTFTGIYFTDEENRWLDVAVGNIRRLHGPYRRALAWFALFQSALAKRPYNLFHRSNLYMRTADVKRGFGNKASWDRGFADHFAAFAAEANAAVIDAGGTCSAMCRDIFDVEPGYDLVYIDPPYINASGVGVDYRSFYHFLEGLVHYDEWPEWIDHRSKHLRLKPQDAPWSDPKRSTEMFRKLFRRFHDSILVVSYRSDGIPSIKALEEMLAEVKGSVQVISFPRYQYALSPNRNSREVLLIGI